MSDIATRFSASAMAALPYEKAAIQRDNEFFNAQINEGKPQSKEMGQEEFMKILIAQLSHQDPTAPMEDKEFIGQMAQLQSLQNMSSMAKDFNRMANLLQGSEATSALGRSVEIIDGDSIIQGTIKAVTREGTAQVLVNGNYYDWDQVSKVFEE
jgi:flagellar basal-body rod modification protein FlgD